MERSHSSVKVGSGVRVLIYEHTNFKGRCMTLSNGRDYPYEPKCQSVRQGNLE
jgi:hypothetical protein